MPTSRRRRVMGTVRSAPLSVGDRVYHGTGPQMRGVIVRVDLAAGPAEEHEYGVQWDAGDEETVKHSEVDRIS